MILATPAPTIAFTLPSGVSIASPGKVIFKTCEFSDGQAIGKDDRLGNKLDAVNYQLMLPKLLHMIRDIIICLIECTM